MKFAPRRHVLASATLRLWNTLEAHTLYTASSVERSWWINIFVGGVILVGSVFWWRDLGGVILVRRRFVLRWSGGILVA